MVYFLHAAPMADVVPRHLVPTQENFVWMPNLFRDHPPATAARTAVKVAAQNMKQADET
jgi:hypothetical protein